MALAASKGTLINCKSGIIRTYYAATGEIFWAGSLVVISLTDGFVYVAVADTDDSEGFLSVGYALEDVDNSSGIDGALSLRVRADGQYGLKFQGIATGKEGRLACIKDDETVQVYGAGTTKVVVGRIVSVRDATYVYVDLADKPLRIATSAND